MVFRYDDDPALYKLARKRQQNKVSAQTSRVERAKQAAFVEETESRMAKKLEELEALCAAKEKEIEELKRKPAEKPLDLFEY